MGQVHEVRGDRLPGVEQLPEAVVDPAEEVVHAEVDAGVDDPFVELAAAEPGRWRAGLVTSRPRGIAPGGPGGPVSRPGRKELLLGRGHGVAGGQPACQHSDGLLPRQRRLPGGGVGPAPGVDAVLRQVLLGVGQDPEPQRPGGEPRLAEAPLEEVLELLGDPSGIGPFMRGDLKTAPVLRIRLRGLRGLRGVLRASSGRTVRATETRAEGVRPDGDGRWRWGRTWSGDPDPDRKSDDAARPDPPLLRSGPGLRLSLARLVGPPSGWLVRRSRRLQLVRMGLRRRWRRVGRRWRLRGRRRVLLMRRPDIAGFVARNVHYAPPLHGGPAKGVRVLRLEARRPAGVHRSGPGDGRGSGGGRDRPRLRRRKHRPDGSRRRRRPRRRRRGDRRDPRPHVRPGDRPLRPHRSADRRVHARAQGADVRAVGRVRRHAGRARHARGAVRDHDLVAARPPRQTDRAPRRRRLLHAPRGFLDQLVTEGFVADRHRRLLRVADKPSALLEQLAAFPD